MKRLVTIAALLILPVVFATGEAKAQDKIRIPFATAFIGPAIEFGERLWRGSQIATEEINAAGGVRGKMLEFYKIDSRSPETIPIVTDYRRACNDEKIPMMVANASSKQLFAIYEHAKQCNMATFAPTSGAYWVFPDNGKWVYRFLPQPQTMLPYLYGKVKEEFGFKTVIISGSLLIVGDVVAVEIEAHHGDEIHEMSDFFTIKNGKVTRLAVYQGPIRKKS